MGCKAIKGTPTYKLQAEAKEANKQALLAMITTQLNMPIAKEYKLSTDINIINNQINSYMDHCLKHDIPLTVGDLVLWLGVDKDYMQRVCDGVFKYLPPEIITLIKRAKNVVENSWSRRLATQYSTGAIFWLKNHGWIDKIDTNVNIIQFGHILSNAVLDAEVIENPKSLSDKVEAKKET